MQMKIKVHDLNKVVYQTDRKCPNKANSRMVIYNDLKRFKNNGLNNTFLPSYCTRSHLQIPSKAFMT